MNNMVIGLVGEDPNDTRSVRHLLEKKISGKITYELLIKNVRGYHLDNPRTKKLLKLECERKKPNIVVFIRDADGICSQHEKILKCETWYKGLSNEINVKHILLLNIYELEALIFADIETFNKEYKTKIKGGKDVTRIKEPKEVLIQQTWKNPKKYSESDCPSLFQKMNVDSVMKNCGYFKEFIEKLEKLMVD